MVLQLYTFRLELLVGSLCVRWFWVSGPILEISGSIWIFSGSKLLSQGLSRFNVALLFSRCFPWGTSMRGLLCHFHTAQPHGSGRSQAMPHVASQHCWLFRFTLGMGDRFLLESLKSLMMSH